MDKIEIYISVATSIITFITLIYNVGIKKGRKREQQYYEKVLQPYIRKVSKKENVDAVSIVEKLVKRDDDDIPKYVTYLIKSDDEEKEEKIRKVLLYDYFCLYPNDSNNQLIIIESISKILYYVFFFISLICLFSGAYYFVEGIRCTSIILYGKIEANLLHYVAVIFIGILLIFISIAVLKLSALVNDDRYTINKKRMTKLINRKTKKFDKHNEDYFF